MREDRVCEGAGFFRVICYFTERDGVVIELWFRHEFKHIEQWGRIRSDPTPLTRVALTMRLQQPP